MVGKKKNRMQGKNIGIVGIETPKENCTDLSCPFHGTLKIRGRIFEGTVKSVKPSNTAIIFWERRVFYPKYERFEKKITRLTAHRPPCMHIKQGDKVVIGECRPVSKTKKFAVIARVDTK